MQKSDVRSRTYASPVGELLLVGSGDTLTGLYLPEDLSCAERNIFRAFQDAKKEPFFHAAKEWLDAYFNAAAPKLSPYTLKLLPDGTPFQKMVWEELCKIPFGTVKTYGEVAKSVGARMGKYMAPIAVGGAVGKNPISIIIPCHRVIGSHGKLTGYAGGLAQKAWLLAHEKLGEQLEKSLIGGREA